jgi:hypothetical protein
MLQCEVKLKNVYFPHNIIGAIRSKVIKLARRLAHMRNEKYVKLFGKHQGNTGKPRHRWEINIKIDIK